MKRALVLSLAATTALACGRREKTAQYDIGTPVTEASLAAYNIDVNPAGAGLPAGSGTVARGAQLYAEKCALCHGANGEGQGAFPKLIGPAEGNAFGFGRDAKLVKTIGNYWPYSTTVFDYIRRAMPFIAPGSLSSDDVYSLTAFLLARNRIIGDNVVIDAQSLPKIRMPAHNHFVRDDRAGGVRFR